MATLVQEGAVRRQGSEGSRPRYDSKVYDEAVLGFKNYWYPIFSSRSVGRKPVGITVMGEGIVLMRTPRGVARALSDECAHRGTILSIGEGCLIKGSDTITCPYHGWTYDLNNGMCVAVLPEGPRSEVPGKIRIRSYPVEERKGIIWVWMGKGAPVPIEEDIPNLMQRDDTIVKFRPRVQYGNWRWHSENTAGGHAQMIHKSSFRVWLTRPRPMNLPSQPHVTHDVDGTGVDNGFIPRGKPLPGEPKPPIPPMYTEYPGLGTWSPQPKWRQILLWPWLRRFRKSLGSDVHGVSKMMMMLPGVFRVPNFPSASNIYYEWYVPVDEDHYLYAQVSCLWGSNPLQRLWKNVWYYVWGKPTGLVQFNNQDLTFTRQTTNYTKRHGIASYPHTKLSRNDDFHRTWRQFASEFARGEGYAYQDGYIPAESPLLGMVPQLPWMEDAIAETEDEKESTELHQTETVPAGGSD